MGKRRWLRKHYRWRRDWGTRYLMNKSTRKYVRATIRSTVSDMIKQFRIFKNKKR